MLSGHIHTFEAINYTKDVPPQIVAGNGGDALLVTPRNLKGAIFQGRSGVTVRDGLSVGGFGFLLLTRDGLDPSSAWTIELYKPDGSAERSLPFHARGRGQGWPSRLSRSCRGKIILRCLNSSISLTSSRRDWRAKLTGVDAIMRLDFE